MFRCLGSQTLQVQVSPKSHLCMQWMMYTAMPSYTLAISRSTSLATPCPNKTRATWWLALRSRHHERSSCSWRQQSSSPAKLLLYNRIPVRILWRQGHCLSLLLSVRKYLTCFCRRRRNLSSSRLRTRELSEGWLEGMHLNPALWYTRGRSPSALSTPRWSAQVCSSSSLPTLGCIHQSQRLW